MKKISIVDVARHANVSLGTVSAVLNGKNTVKPDTQKLVLKVIKDLQYRPAASARNMRNSRSTGSAICLVIRELNNPFYNALTLGVKEYAQKHGYILYVASSEGDHAQEESIISSFVNKDIRGAIIAPVLDGKSEIEHLFRLRTLNFPFVLLENVLGIQANVVSINNLQAMKEAMNYLYKNGHTKIVHFSGPQHASHTYERIDGFRQAFSESHFAFKKEMIVPTGASIEAGYRSCLKYFHNRKSPLFPTAIVCYNDLVAFGVMAALKELNLKIPDDISVIGNDDIAFAKHAPVPLSTIHAPIDELGKKAAEILIQNIESPQPLKICITEFEAHFIVRESSQKAKR